MHYIQSNIYHQNFLHCIHFRPDIWHHIHINRSRLCILKNTNEPDPRAYRQGESRINSQLQHGAGGEHVSFKIPIVHLPISQRVSGSWVMIIVVHTPTAQHSTAHRVTYHNPKRVNQPICEPCNSPPLVLGTTPAKRRLQPSLPVCTNYLLSVLQLTVCRNSTVCKLTVWRFLEQVNLIWNASSPHRDAQVLQAVIYVYMLKLELIRNAVLAHTAPYITQCAANQQHTDLAPY
jgi:hypothetical protein